MIQEETNEVQEFIQEDIWGTIKEVLDWGLHIGEGNNSINITLGLLLAIIFAFIAATFMLKWLRRLLTRNMDGDDKLKFTSVFKFIKYIVYLAVVLTTMSAAGIDITILVTASAVLFVGLGFALQDLFQDLIGGVFIILDKSLQAGDIVEVDGKVGKVFEIKLRTTLALTRDDKVIIIPNHHFMSNIVYNYTQNHKITREFVTIGVAYGSDITLVSNLLLACVASQEDVLKTPEAFVLFDDFGDSALVFSVHFFVDESFTSQAIKSHIRYKIDAKFRENNVSIPFPQRDVHLIQNRPFQHQDSTSSENRAGS